jgi:Fe(3+) dicitrate transport protein
MQIPFENKTITRNQPLFGIEWNIKCTNVYANITQAYRPVLFSDITPPAEADARKHKDTDNLLSMV